MLAISGDALLGISRQLNQGISPRERPLAMDLLWSVRTLPSPEVM